VPYPVELISNPLTLLLKDKVIVSKALKTRKFRNNQERFFVGQCIVTYELGKLNKLSSPVRAAVLHEWVTYIIEIFPEELREVWYLAYHTVENPVTRGVYVKKATGILANQLASVRNRL